MRLTVAGKIITSIVTVLLVGSVAILIIYNGNGLASVKRAMQSLADIREPISAAAHEMEINVNGIALGVLKYLNVREPAIVSWWKKTRHRSVSETERSRAW